MSVKMAMVKKGQQVRLKGLRQQGNLHAKLIATHAARLLKVNWTAANTERFNALLAELSSGRADQIEARQAAKSATRGQNAEVVASKRFVRLTRGALVDALEDAEAAGETSVSKEDFDAGGPLGKSVTGIVEFLEKIAPSVKTIDRFLSPYLDLPSASAELAARLSALQGADAQQELDVAIAPAETLALNQTKGDFLTLIEKVNRAGKRAFDGDAEVIGTFNKDLILRAQGEAEGTEEEGPGVKGGESSAGG